MKQVPITVERGRFVEVDLPGMEGRIGCAMVGESMELAFTPRTLGQTVAVGTVIDVDGGAWEVTGTRPSTVPSLQVLQLRKVQP